MPHSSILLYFFDKTCFPIYTCSLWIVQRIQHKLLVFFYWYTFIVFDTNKHHELYIYIEKIELYCSVKLIESITQNLFYSEVNEINLLRMIHLIFLEMLCFSFIIIGLKLQYYTCWESNGKESLWLISFSFILIGWQWQKTSDNKNS